jgi:hypothetical protein
MIKDFENLSTEEYDKLRKSVAWVALLIAGADGKIDSEEISWASKIAKIRSYSNPDLLNEFYQDVASDFDTYFADIIENSSKDTKTRTTIASDKIAEINPILAKLTPYISYNVYKSLTSFATHVAKASGGFLRMWSISHEEDKYINLPMLVEIPFAEEPEA